MLSWPIWAIFLFANACGIGVVLLGWGLIELIIILST